MAKGTGVMKLKGCGVAVAGAFRGGWNGSCWAPGVPALVCWLLEGGAPVSAASLNSCASPALLLAAGVTSSGGTGGCWAACAAAAPARDAATAAKRPPAPPVPLGPARGAGAPLACAPACSCSCCGSWAMVGELGSKKSAAVSSTPAGQQQRQQQQRGWRG
jgi:hypothetical protein